MKAPSPKRKPPISLKQDALLCIPYAQAGLTAHFDLKPKPGINLIVENCGKLIHFNEASEHSKPKEMYLSIMQTTNEKLLMTVSEDGVIYAVIKKDKIVL